MSWEVNSAIFKAQRSKFKDHDWCKPSRINIIIIIILYKKSNIINYFVIYINLNCLI